MIRRIASIISVIFHPLVLPSLLFLIIYITTPFILTPYNRPQFLLIVFLSTFVIPGIGVLALYVTGVVKSLVMNDSGERAVPFTFTAIFYWVMSYLFFSHFKESLTIIVLMMSISTTVSVIAIISYFWKISAHSAGITGMIGSLFVIGMKYPEVHLIYPLSILVVLSGIIMSGRLYLQVHNIKEVFAGGMIGFILNFFVLFFLT